MNDRPFKLVSEYTPQGDQPGAIRGLLEGIDDGLKYQTLLGATGTGKTYVMANVIQSLQKPTLVLAPNKTLAAQLYQEFREFFPENAVEYFVSYYDYYQPEAYLPSTNTYIAKDASVNEAIDRMRHSATRSLIERKDVIIVASVSCIYGIGDKGAYQGMLIELHEGQEIDRNKLLRHLVDIQYNRNDYDFHRGTFRVRGDAIEVFPAYEDEEAIRLEFFGDELEAISRIDPVFGKRIERIPKVAIFPGSHYVTPADQLKKAITRIQNELHNRLYFWNRTDQHVESQRLSERTYNDIERMEHWGFCTGIENYSRHLTGRKPNQAPPVLIDYFPDDFLCIVDESHLTVSQVGAMFRGDRSRKETLVRHGFRLPSALDNRPLKFNEFEDRLSQAVFVSATPSAYELDVSDSVHDLVIRPTGLLDPKIVIRPVADQVDDLLHEIRLRVERGERVLATTLTKRMSEHLTEHYDELGVRVRYLHSDVETLKRIELLDDLRRGTFDVLVGINLLREGLDLPEVSLVAILDADKEGFLRSARSLIQTIGRAARHVNGTVIMYADRVTNSMRTAIDETERRRTKQMEHNTREGIEPKSVIKAIRSMIGRAGDKEESQEESRLAEILAKMSEAEFQSHITRLRKGMWKAAERRDFEEAAELRDKIKAYETMHLALR
jgi:excinuclease ABC subunit B